MGMHAGNGVQSKVRDVEDLRKRIVQVWNDLDQRIIDWAVRKWCKRFRACVEVKGGQFQYRVYIFIHCLRFSYKFHEFIDIV